MWSSSIDGELEYKPKETVIIDIYNNTMCNWNYLRDLSYNTLLPCVAIDSSITLEEHGRGELLINVSCH